MKFWQRIIVALWFFPFLFGFFVVFLAWPIFWIATEKDLLELYFKLDPFELWR